MKIAFLGSRGIPARYSGFETFYEQLAVRLVARGHDVTVYNRSHFIQDVKKEYRGVWIVSLPSIPTKHLDTITHTALSSLHAIFARYDIAYYCIVGNSPLCWMPRPAGTKTLLNVDGEDWAREKWGAFARWYQRRAEKLAGYTADVLIADARGVKERYERIHGMPSVFVPYGANIAADPRTDALDRFGVRPHDYFLYVGRLVPENAIDLLIRAYAHVKTGRRLVIIGDAPHADAYKKALKSLAARDDRVLFTGYAFGEAYAQWSTHAYAVIQPSGVQGTRPALLDQMGFGNAVLVRDSEVNMEVVADAGDHFDRRRPEESLTERLQYLNDHPGDVETWGRRARERIRTFYNWERVTDYYEHLFGALLDNRAVADYDVFLASANRD